jgi:uncharacterized protein YecE (DUF72 family)
MVLIGVAGWSYDDWAGRVYPRRKPRGFHPLEWLARYLDLMEVNGSFYAPPQTEHARSWARLVEPHPDFRFTVKLHRSFTHEPEAAISARAARDFLRGIAPLRDAGRLLALLVQFPVSLRADEAAWRRLERIRDLFPWPRLMLELRHRSFFTSDALGRLRSLDVGLVHVDLPAARDHPPGEHPSLGDLGYLRLHGRNASAWFDRRAGRDERYDYRYGESEVEEMADRLRRIAGSTERTLLVANNHFRGQAVANALEVKALLSGGPVPAPPPLLAAFPDLARVVRTEGQMTLW